MINKKVANEKKGERKIACKTRNQINGSNRKRKRKCTLSVNGEWERQEEKDMIEGKAKAAISDSATVATSSHIVKKSDRIW